VGEELNSKLFSAVNSLRDKMYASEYKYYLLGLTFYKYLSDKLLEKVVVIANKSLEEYNTQEKQTILYRELLANADMKSDLIETLVDTLSYDIEPDYLFNVLIEQAKRNMFQLVALKEAFAYLSTKYDQFSGLFDDVDLNSKKIGADAQERNITITEVLKKLNDVNVLGHDIGDAYELLIRKFASEAGKKAGEFYTLHEVSDMMARIASIGQEDKRLFSVFDPTMGSGSLMLNVRNYIDYPDGVKYYGQELNTTTYNLAKMNLILHGIEKENMRLRNEDALNKDWPTDEPYTFDAVLMNPPYSTNWYADETFLYDSRFNRYGGLAPKSRADFAFLLHGFYHLKESGTMVIVLPHGVLFRGAAEGIIRKKLLEDGSIDAVIGMPANLFLSTSIPTTVIVLKKNRGKRDVFFINASKDFVKGKNKNKLTEESIEKIVDAYKKRKNIEKYAYVATFEEIKENDYNLNIPRYVNMYSDTIGETGRYLKDIADIFTYQNSVESEGFFLTYKDLKYPLAIKNGIQNNYGIQLKYGDIIVFRSGRKYLFYENELNIYLLANQQNIPFVIRPKRICPEALFLYLETEEVSTFLFDMSGTSFANVQRSVLETLPISKELPPINAHKKNKPYINLFEEKYYIPVSISNLSRLFQSVQIKLTENTNNNQLAKECIKLIETGEEGIYWDFKQKHYSNKARLLHDIICMANNIADRDAYIIIGVEDKTGRVVGAEKDEKRKDTTHFNNILKTVAFFAGNIPVFSLGTFAYKNHEIDVLEIKHTKNRPFFLIEDYRDRDVVVRKNTFYARESDSNTDIDKSASVRAIEHLWYERFINN